jgi:hypothetical protein
MLKLVEVYDVIVILNDGGKLTCTLFSKPEAALLTSIAAVQNAGSNLIEALLFAQNIVVPPATESLPYETNIVVGGTIIGTVSVNTRQAYLVPPRRGRKPKST